MLPDYLTKLDLDAIHEHEVEAQHEDDINLERR